jgi:outer membrane protein OmpA-like peptidoglycan-associated protein
VSISRATLNQLKKTGTVDFKFGVNGLQDLMSAFKKLSDAADNNKQGPKGSDIAQGLMAMDTSPEKSCTLRRVGSADLALPVLVNNQPVNLPALHAACKPADSDQEANFYFLDDPNNALALAWQLGAKSDRLQAIKISWPSTNPPPAQQLEKQLADTGRAQVYGIYFDFASDQLRPESAEVLKEISQVMQDHPDWKLKVNGHTDNIGGDAFNMDLSRRRAEAVKAALTREYQIAPDRLTTAGFGATMPVASNDTMEGRARNRRVELVRQ